MVIKNFNRLKKFMQVEIDVKCMHTNFGLCDLFSFRDFAHFLCVCVCMLEYIVCIYTCMCIFALSLYFNLLFLQQQLLHWLLLLLLILMTHLDHLPSIVSEGLCETITVNHTCTMITDYTMFFLNSVH